MKSNRILLVEDNDMDVELALHAFKVAKIPSAIQVVTNGQDALDYMHGSGEYSDRSKYPLPHLVLLDLKMPEIDGFEVLRQLKSTPIIRRIPVVILTSSVEPMDRTLTYDYGANGYLAKPLSFTDFVEMVRNIYGFWLVNNIPPDGLE